MKLQGKVAAITGGASGIGAATVQLFLDEGAHVAFADRHCDTSLHLSSGALFIKADMKYEAEAAAFIGQTESHFGRLDILVNNAAIRMYQTVVDASNASWDDILAVNLKAYAFCAKAAIPAMQPGSSIINVASIRAVRAGPNTPQYDATKAAVLALTRSMAYSHAQDGIRVNAVAPGAILTGFHEKRAAYAGQHIDAFTEAFGAETMLGRPGTPLEVANGILFLASDDASFITGTTLYVDGGATAR